MIVALSLLGCSAWIDQEPACDQDIYFWSDDVLAYVMEGDGSGAFEFDPIDDPRTEISGEYDASSGDFDWKTKYDEDYYLRKSDVDGFGTAYHNGNLDLLWTATVTDMLGDIWDNTFRVQRTGCDMTIASWGSDGDIDSAFVQEGTYEDDSVWSWSADVSGYTWQGSLRQNLLRTQQIEADDGSYWSFTTNKPTGETEQEFETDCGSGLRCNGSSVRNFDGTLDESYEAFDGTELVATIEGAYDYDGSGTETIDYVGGPECVFDYDADGGCTYECDDGDDGSC